MGGLDAWKAWGDHANDGEMTGRQWGLQGVSQTPCRPWGPQEQWGDDAGMTGTTGGEADSL